MGDNRCMAATANEAQRDAGKAVSAPCRGYGYGHQAAGRGTALPLPVRSRTDHFPYMSDALAALWRTETAIDRRHRLGALVEAGANLPLGEAIAQTNEHDAAFCRFRCHLSRVYANDLQ